jgi:hypothetical protein
MDTVISHTWIELRKRLPRPCKHSPGYSCSRGFMDTVISHTCIELHAIWKSRMFLQKKIRFTLLLTVSSVLTSFFETIDQLYPGPWKLLKKCIRIHVFIWVFYRVCGASWATKRLPRPCKHSPGYSCSRGFTDTVISHTWMQLYPGESRVHGNSCAAVSMWIWGPLSLFNNCIQVSIGSMEPLEQRYPGEYRIHGASWTTVSRWV